MNAITGVGYVDGREAAVLKKGASKKVIVTGVNHNNNYKGSSEVCIVFAPGFITLDTVCARGGCKLAIFDGSMKCCPDSVGKIGLVWAR
jgi:Pherophorin